MRIAIVGGGLAGLTCAKSLVDAGHEVAIHEGMPFLGGRASTFRDDDGDWIEQGLHLFLGTYSEFKTLLDEIGRPPDDTLYWMTQLRIEDPAGPTATYGTNPFLAPFTTALSAAGQNRFLGPLDKLSVALISAGALRSMQTLREEYDQKSVAELWRDWKGTDDVLERVLRPFCRAIQFTDVEQFSAFNFLGWMHHVAYDLPHSLAGAYRGAREELVFQPLARYLTDRTATIYTGVQLREILYSADERRLEGFVMETGERVEADRYVVAIPSWAFAKFIPAPLRRDPYFRQIIELPVAPAISVQLWFDQRVTDTDAFTLVARTVVPVYQDQCTNTYPYSGGSRLSVTISPADHYLEWSDEQLVKLTIESLAGVRPEVREARIVKSVVLKHRQHLVRPLPGAMSARPFQTTPVKNLFLAGDWTQQDYFGSQEGAVRSGRACAEQILKASSTSHSNRDESARGTF